MRLTGKFDKQRLYFTFRIKKPRSYSPGKNCQGIIDTGFTGFVLLPQDRILALGLSLMADATSTTVTTADGRDHNPWTATCVIYVGKKAIEGTALVLPKGANILYGMELLEKANTILILNFKDGTYELSD